MLLITRYHTLSTFLRGKKTLIPKPYSEKSITCEKKSLQPDEHGIVIPNFARAHVTTCNYRIIISTHGVEYIIRNVA